MPREGLIDYCAASEDLRGEVGRLRGLGFGVEGPGDGGRSLPDETEIRWRSASIRQEGRAMPFLIEDLTPRGRRVPGGTAADHPNGATGIARLEVSSPDPARAAWDLAALADAGPGPPVIGACELTLTRGVRGHGPRGVELSIDGTGREEALDPALAHGVRFRLRRGGEG